MFLSNKYGKQYLLDIGECVELAYEEKEVEAQLEFMDKNFTRDFSVLNIEDFSKANKKSCSACLYFKFCK